MKTEPSWRWLVVVLVFGGYAGIACRVPLGYCESDADCIKLYPGRTDVFCDKGYAVCIRHETTQETPDGGLLSDAGCTGASCEVAAHDAGCSPAHGCYRHQWVDASAPAFSTIRGATLLPDGRVLVHGIADDNDAGVQFFEPSSGAWSPVVAAPGILSDQTLLPTGNVLFLAISRALVFDPARARWLSTGPLRRMLSSPSTTVLRNGNVLVCGGDDLVGMSQTSSCQMFFTDLGQWADGPPMKGARARHTATLLMDGRVLVAGGVAAANAEIVATAELLDLQRGGWIDAPPLKIARTGHTATMLRDGRVLVIGGLPTWHGATAVVEMFDPLLESWSSVEELPGPKVGHEALALLDNTVLVAGGTIGGDIADDERTMEILDLKKMHWGPRTPFSQFATHSLLLLNDGRAFAIGRQPSSSISVLIFE